MEIREAKLYTIREVAEILGMDSAAVWRLVKQGKIKAIPSAKREKIRIFGKFLLRFMEGGNDV